MSIETKIDELIQAITANTEALNSVLAQAGTTPQQVAQPAKKRAVKEAPAKVESAPDNIVLTSENTEGTPIPAREGTPEQIEAEDRQAEREEAAAAAAEPEKPSLSGITASDIRDYVKKVQVNYATNGMDTKKILKTVTEVRESYGASNLNDLTPEQTGPFMAKIVELLPLKD
jgi:hypothetical protein